MLDEESGAVKHESSNLQLLVISKIDQVGFFTVGLFSRVERVANRSRSILGKQGCDLAFRGPSTFDIIRHLRPF